MNKQKQKREMNRFIRNFRKQLQTDKWFEGRFDIQEIQMGVGYEDFVFKRYVFTYFKNGSIKTEESRWVNMLDIRREILNAYNTFIHKCGHTGPIMKVSEQVMDEYSEAYKELAK